MNNYFIGREKDSLLNENLQFPMGNVYFVDDKVDQKVKINHYIIKNSTFSNIGFKKSQFMQCDFSFSVFIDCYFKRAELNQVKFQSCKFINCNFEGAVFVDCNFHYAEFENCYIPYSAMKENLPHERENVNGALCRNLSIQCLDLGAVEDYKQYLFEERKSGEIHEIRKLFHPSESYYNKYSFFDGIKGLLYFLRSKASKYLWGYGEKMSVLIRNIILVIFGYAIPYSFHIDNMIEHKLMHNDYLSAIYLSACTFFSANIKVNEQNLIWNCILLSEHILGAILIGFFGAALFRQINRR